ncbi:MAG: TRAP transporter small permease [Paracoccaceae bacterium]|uniref:TRAP transporter small permease n=1 Tax=unclassified Seohaeicola TaxID=2641111 RepID=UPI00237AEF41|nr:MULTISPECIES: TRAP transporter small permease [unclassified Seohaeicola]MDD9708537.1 TRAP transporter small permease [Seohaeicola sp. 4SK31]MDD9736636.1 TRAP transporter small permease [Seohaeicola sp. SP36]MDF1709326.1 TRAP transporter small permease [Paracoccaceae bacterium]MDM7971172.1 TRAP transporter small permease [Paracoccaceae bacterium]
MSGPGRYEPRSMLGKVVHEFEETAIAVMLGAMTILTFVNVIMRYVFNSMVIWGLEVVLILFSWLVLFGIAYAFKVTANLGVDAIISVVSPRARYVLALLSAACCIVYALLIAKGAWDYWAPFAGLQQTTGHWFPTGFDPNTRDRAFFETDQVPMLEWLRWLEDAINQGESYSKMPRMVPYLILPVAAALMLFRIIQVTIRIVKGEQHSMIVSHEVEDALDEIAKTRRGQE